MSTPEPAPVDLETGFAEHAARLADLELPHALAAGDRAPEFALPNARGRTITLSDLLRRGPVVLTFYRGGWCPYCRAHLRGLQQTLPQILELGAALVAVSPQTPDNSLATAQRNALAFEVLSDVNSYVASDYGVVFGLGREDRELFLTAGNDLGKVNGDDAWLLPAPATFVIDRHGVIRHAHVDGNYTRRIDPIALLRALRALDR